MISLSGYQWASGLNNAAGLVAVENDVPKYRNKPFIVQGRGRFRDGELLVRGDFSVTAVGNTSFTWLAPVMGVSQYAYLRAKSSSGTGFYANMTVRTRNSLDVFANYNAVLQIPPPDALERRSDAFLNVVLHFAVTGSL